MSTIVDVPGDSAPGKAAGFVPGSSICIEKSDATALPPLLLMTCLMTISVAAWREFTNVQVTFSPSLRLIEMPFEIDVWEPPFAEVTEQVTGDPRDQPATGVSVTE